MFNSILIANRGEIACRVARTCRRMGIRAIAIHSDADAGALHTVSADFAVGIGGASAAESYLNIESVLRAAKDTGADAVHPGYGFLSENAEFAEACENAGIVFIGPPPEVIRAMGSKSAAKALMAKAGVPILPGYHGDAQDTNTLHEAASGVGYPVLLKPSAGGGGRGMRLVEREDELEFAIDAARREALSSFGDDHLLVEKYLARPRHIEVQVFADTSGNIVHLFERDCSVQRRHQKVVEEAPAPGLAKALRDNLGKTAVAAVKAVGYVGAGTVEFLLDLDGGFYFMEMNTRLQVEHPVTEEITGQDLVEWQFRVAAGEKLPLPQTKIQISGHAIEVRLYAEDPARDFLPAAGRLTHLRLPEDGNGIRVDGGVRQGDEVTAHYDPMIAKLIASGKDRTEALTRLDTALSGVQIAGPATNTDFLAAIARDPEFARGGVDTGFIEARGEALLPAWSPASKQVRALAALAVIERRTAAAREIAALSTDRHSPWSSARGWRLNAASCELLTLLDGEEVVEITVDDELRAMNDYDHITATVICDGNEITVFGAGETRRFTLIDSVADAESETSESVGTHAAPMPGVVVAVLVEPGATVEKGAALIAIEAMKVEHTIRAIADGVVDAVHFAVGDRIQEGDELVAFTPTTE